MREGADPAGGTAATATVSARRLARILAVPASVLSFLEARLPEVRALDEGSGRAYRAADAVLLAGVAELLYTDGLSFRDVQALLRSPRRERVVERGRARLRGVAGGAGGASGAPAAPMAIPDDALVRRRAEGVPSRERPGRTAEGQSPEVAAILADLMACVRRLEAAR